MEPIRVLHVDDDPDVVDLAATFLEQEDDRFVVETATSVEAGRDRLTGSTFDCVVSDYDMPGQNGIEFLETVREERPDLPFVLFTGKGSEEIASEAISAGVTDYLQKRTGTDQYTILANRISNAVDAYRTRRRAARHERINDLIRNTTRRLVEAETADEITQTVCETIAASDPYRFAWIGEPDPETGEVLARASAGDAEAFLDDVTIRYDETARADGPAGRAIRSREIQLAQNIPEDESFRPWWEIAERLGFESVVVLPLADGGSLHGILVIYADRPYAFDETEQDVLSELADTISSALTATETRRTLEARERELERYKTVVESSGDPVYMFDPDGRFTFVNERLLELTGHERDQLLGAHASKILEQTDVDRGGELIRSLLSSDGDHETIEMTVHTADGEEVPCEIHIGLLPMGPDGAFRGTAGIIRDITDRRRRERELEAQNTRLERFATIVSHDLRNPLHVASGHLELAQEECATDHLDSVDRAHQQMEALIEDLLSLARDGDLVDETERIDLETFVTDRWRNVDAEAAELVVETDAVVHADRGRLAQLVENLLSNAVEHGSTDPGSQAQQDSAERGGPGVTVTVRDLDGGFAIEDDGPGIPPADREQVFESGYSTADRGTGFGLSIVSQIAEAHGWRVAVTESADGGARFEIRGVDVE